MIVVLDEHLEGVPVERLSGAAQLIYVGTALPEAARGADVVLPATNVAEEDGTLVNRDGRVQRYFQAKAGPGMARPAWWAFGEILAELNGGHRLGGAHEVFEKLASVEPAFEGLSYEALGHHGASVAGMGVTA